MPIYEYKCNSCGVVVEKVRPIKDKNLPMECPYCLSETQPLDYPTSIAVSTPGSDSNPIDIKVGGEAEKLNADIADRKSARDKIRREVGQNGLSVTPQGKVTPVSDKVKEIRTNVLGALSAGGNKYI